MADAKTAHPPKRIRIFHFFDLITVADPDQIRQIEASGAVDRLHVNGSMALPRWVRLYFRATKFYDNQRDHWFVPFDSTSEEGYVQRRRNLADKTATGYRPEDVTQIAQLLRAGVDDVTLGYHMVQIVNRRFLDADIPKDICAVAQHPVQTPAEAIRPWRYIRGRKAQTQMLDYCAQALAPGSHVVDVSHNIGEVMQATVPALRRLHNNVHRPVEEIFTAHAPTPQTLRIAVEESTLDGLVSSPMTPNRTVLIYKIGEAAALTGDIRFTFGTGTDDRLCVFADFFLSFMADLQQELTISDS